MLTTSGLSTTDKEGDENDEDDGDVSVILTKETKTPSSAAAGLCLLFCPICCPLACIWQSKRIHFYIDSDGTLTCEIIRKTFLSERIIEMRNVDDVSVKSTRVPGDLRRFSLVISYKRESKKWTEPIGEVQEDFSYHKQYTDYEERIEEAAVYKEYLEDTFSQLTTAVDKMFNKKLQSKLSMAKLSPPLSPSLTPIKMEMERDLEVNDDEVRSGQVVSNV